MSETLTIPGATGTGSGSAVINSGITIADFEGVGSGSVSSVGFVEIVNPSVRYYCKLVETNTTSTVRINLELPISSFACRRRSGNPTYLSVVAPYTSDRMDIIDSRTYWYLKVYMAYVVKGVEVLREEIAYVSLDSIRTDLGSKSASITLSGYLTATYSNQELTLGSPMYAMNDNGRIMLLFAKPDIYLRPGATLTAGDYSFEVGEIDYNVSVSDGGRVTSQMYVKEAEE